MEIALGSLKAFDAVARHLSFKLAAKELSLSPSAVSHAIAKLERGLGILLFDREGSKLALTLDGKALHQPLEEAFGLIGDGINAVLGRRTHLLRIHSAPSFATQWLAPRLSRFLVAHPNIEVRIAAGTDYSRFAADEFDADIVYNGRDQECLVSHSLGSETVAPMCCPILAERIHSPADLYDLTLIHNTRQTSSWSDWFQRNGLHPAKAIEMRFDRSFMAIAAAADGIGVCLDSTRLAERELASGRLVLPLSGVTQSLERIDHFLVYPRRNARRPMVMAFTRWLLGELANEQNPASIQQTKDEKSDSVTDIRAGIHSSKPLPAGSGMLAVMRLEPGSGKTQKLKRPRTV